MNEIANNSQDKMLFLAVKQIIEAAREKSYRAVNSYLLESYWNIGKLIVEHEQKGASRAAYGESVLKNLSIQLTEEFGKGFDTSNLRNMRTFYAAFPIYDALRHKLSWTHYRILSRLESEEKRNYYIQQSVENGWNSRELERNIHTLWFERRIQEPPRQLPDVPTIQSTLKDPYVF
jgi:predicted nuclease of restriction endonuclease-like (RecB) superfamily